MVTNYNCDIDDWHLYDSLDGELYRKSMGLIHGQISLIFPETNYVFLTNRSVQRQEGVNDCGLFALAYMYTLVSGNDPSTYYYKQSQMRDHYNNCVTNKNFEAFPHTILTQRHIKDKKFIYDVKKDKWHK